MQPPGDRRLAIVGRFLLGVSTFPPPPRGLSTMYGSLSESSGHTEYPPLTTGIHAQLHYDTSPSSGLRLPLQPAPSFLPSGAPAVQSHLATRGPDPQATLAGSGQSTTLARQISPTTFPAHPLPTQFLSERLHNPYNSFPGQYVMSTPPSLLQNRPSQPHVYRGYHPLGPSPTRYFPLPPQPYFQHSSSMRGRNPPYQQPRHLPSPTLQVETTSLGPSRARSYGDVRQLYALHTHNSTDHFDLMQQYQPTSRWYSGCGPDSSADTFIQGGPMRQGYIYPHHYPPTQRPRRDSNAFRIQSTGSESLPPPSLQVAPSSSSAVVNASQHNTSAADNHPPERISVQSSQKTDTPQPSQKSAASTSRPPDRPLVRRQHHPNPPPNRSEWALWVGNVPSDATQDELSRFLKKPAPWSSGTEGGTADDSGLISIFLVSRSNCAFANYQSEEHMNRAISRFNGRKMRPHDRRCLRLVCRARRQDDDLRAGVGAQRGMGIHMHYVKNVPEKRKKKLLYPRVVGQTHPRRAVHRQPDRPPRMKKLQKRILQREEAKKLLLSRRALMLLQARVFWIVIFLDVSLSSSR